ncbi:NUDIX domain-containing protein [Fictibacillus norfolkensis]|uniref:NUDIX hydrolase n=1 Tax=Fictibacillus norfolkensis TaxID=2762233 RepID=A0ABR8SJ79_9BACL|nr:NUDIX hydrolase [Fictibacillus norfolkensis]MBD7963535.1 NUDIX hydrolase [Fictibacillus norfolkensis]
MLAQGVVIHEGKVLLVRQKVKRGDIVWNYPGGGVEDGETFEQACVREVMEETGYTVKIIKSLFQSKEKQTFLCERISGTLSIEDDEDILDVRWIDLKDNRYFDDVSRPVVEMVFKTMEVV